MHFPAVPDTLIRIMRDVKPVTEIKQNGEEFVVTVKTPLRSTTNTFTLGREATMKTLEDKTLKVSAHGHHVRFHTATFQWPLHSVC